MNWNDHDKLWNHVFIKVMDVRRMLMEQGETLRSYNLPASAFFYTVRGSARIWLDGSAGSIKRFHVLHGGKGACLDIEADELLEYYMILYKATLPPPSRQELQALMERCNPFQMQYELDPHYPLPLFDKVTAMSREWLRPGASDALYVKTLFYQFLYELQSQLREQGIQAVKPDPVAQAIRYMQHNYRKPITLETLAGLLDLNTRQFLRMFKSRLNTSPIDYLIQIRMNKAKELLLHSEFTLKHIAEWVGYSDSYYFSRIFKKVEGVSPSGYKEHARRSDNRRNNPSRLSGYPIAARRLRRYSNNGVENHYQYNEKGDFQMYRKSRASMAVTLLFCFSLLLSACSTGSGTANNSGGTAAPGGSQNATSSVPAAGQMPDKDAPRLIKHAMGETTLQGTPQRVVILTNEGTEALLAVGIKPVGAVQSWIGDPWYDHIKDDMKNVSAVGDELQPNIEMIASLKPDLIIGNKVRQEKIYEQLKKIAPTVYSEDLGGDWKINFKLYAEAVNKKEEGDKAMAAFDKRVADVKAKLGSKAATKVSVARFSASQVRIYQKQTFSGVLLSQLGFARPASQDKDSFIEVMTKEKIPSMDGDVLFYFVTEAAGKTDAAKVVQEWKNDPLFQNLNVSKTGNIVQVDEAIWNSAGGYEAANLLLDELVKYFDIK
ncbi:AraC family transcriptional regulator [Paenibacillus oceani]|uniref:AraC family transcriptional regulator n=1 Tax=Paenibacillus oceani TaxID=2772510 RepID=A0A927CA93_9BACL|nr:AraC family transcriptional regulator [Paenibacillus oceani]MBD2864313.1 AraC family transcriptional regulator [Paenibacillus oceani]